jgi:PAS domain S-box-containing protein
VSGIVVIVYLTLKRQERLHEKITQRTKDLEQEFRQRLSVEDDLDKSQAALLDASRRAHIGIWECDVMTDEFYWSDELFHIIDETPFTFTPTIESFLTIIHPEDIPVYLQFRRTAIYEKKSGEFEIRIIKPKGGIVFCWITINPKLNPAGELTTLWGIAQDITVIKEAERQLMDTNRILQMVNLCDQIIVRETDERILLEKVCQTMANLGEYRCILVAEQAASDDQDFVTLFTQYSDPVILSDPDILINKYTRPLIHKAIYEKAESIWFREEQKTATGRKAPLRNLPYSFMATLPIQLSDTTSGVLAIFDARPPFIGDEEISHLHQLADDLSIGIQSIRRKESYAHALEALRVSENKFAKAFHTSPDSIAITRLKDGTYIDVNEGFVTNSGYSREEIIGKKLDDINVWSRLSDRDHIVKELKKNGVISNYEADFVAKDGHTRTGLFSARLIEIEGEVDLLSITRDISDGFEFPDHICQSIGRANPRFYI